MYDVTELIEEEVEELGEILEKHGIEPDSEEGERIMSLIGLIAVRLAKSELVDIANEVNDRVETAMSDISRLEDDLDDLRPSENGGGTDE